MSERRLASEETVEGRNVCRICARGIYRALGIERGLLPSRVYRGAAGCTKRYFPVKLPVALDADRAVFVYADPGHETSTALRSWGHAHRGLWEALGDRGRSVEIVAVQTRREMARARTILGNWAEAPTASGPSDPARREIARIEQAIRCMDEALVEGWPGLRHQLIDFAVWTWSGIR